MKKWGLLVSAYYTLAVLAMFWPAYWGFYFSFAEDGRVTWSGYLGHMRDIYSSLGFTVPVAVVFLGQIVLLFVSVDTSNRRLKPRAHIALPAVLTGLFLAVLGMGIVTSVFLALYRDNFFDYLDNNYLARTLYLLFWPALWLVWAIIFYFYARKDKNPVSRAVSWILKGSILEFLVVVPCHVIVRRRDDCCAPYATSLGLCTGLAIMFISFGPSVLLLYKKRLASYANRSQS